jgi:hypothetical protein
MRRVRARWFLGLGLLVSAAAISCGSGDSAGLFTSSTGGAGAIHGSSGASNQAGAQTGTAGDEGGGAFNQTGGAGTDPTSGAPGAGMDSTDGGGSGSAAGGSMGTAGKGGSGKAGGGGAGGKGGGGAPAGGAAGAGAGGALAGAGSGGTAAGGGSAGGGTSGGGGAGPVSCSDNAGCGESQYCAKPDCSLAANGTCTARPIDCSGTAETALCGCDGFTYHDACLMHLNGENSLAAGACVRVGVTSTNTVTCSAANDPACTAKNGVCGFRADTACPSTLPLKGVCWVVPTICPAAAAVPKGAEVCNPAQQGPNSFCVSECTAVKSQVRYAVTAMCN